MRISPMITAAALAVSEQGVATAAGCLHWPAEVYLLRHAEKMNDDDDSPLSPAGWQRAWGLPASLAPVRVGAIFVSDKLRTQQTALSLTTHTGIKPVVFPQNDIAGLVQAVCDAGSKGDGAVVVVGHTTTVPKIMEEMGLASKVPDFGDLFVVNPKSGRVNQRRYGNCNE